MIFNWDGLASEFFKYKVPVVLICNSKDEFELLKFIVESGGIKNYPYPFFFDRMNKYLKLNKFMENSSDFETILTDKNNNILLVGNPIHSKRVKNLYINEVQKRFKKY